MNTPVKIVLIFLGCIILGGIFLAKIRSQSSPQSTFVPDVHNDKVIIVSGWSQQELERILSEFQSMYAERLHPSFSIHTDQSGPYQFHLHFPGDMEPMIFHFLINYIRYPKDLEPSGRSILVADITTLDRQFNLPSPSLIGQKATIYVPADDQDFDLVFVKTDGGETFKDSFASSTWKLVPSHRMPSGLENLK